MFIEHLIQQKCFRRWIEMDPLLSTLPALCLFQKHCIGITLVSYIPGTIVKHQMANVEWSLVWSRAEPQCQAIKQCSLL